MLNYGAYELIGIMGVFGSLTIFLKVSRNMGTVRQVRLFKTVLVFYMIYAGSNYVWALGENDSIKMSVMANEILNCLALSSLSLMMYHWFKYCMVTINPDRSYSKKLVALLTIPLVFSVGITVASIWTDGVYKITEFNQYMPGKQMVMKFVLDYFYIIAATAYALICAFTTKSKNRRKLCMTIGAFIFVPIGRFILRRLLPHEPTTMALAFFVILWIFLNMQDLRIYSDALTGMNNRRRLNEYLGDRLSEIQTNGAFYIFIADVNNFKEINDEFGHISGDHALVVVANAVKKAVNSVGGFAARYGGDEFVLVCDANKVDPERAVESINRYLEDEIKRDGRAVNWNLTVSIGYTLVNGGDRDGAEALSRADSMMYKGKMDFHSRNPQP